MQLLLEPGSESIGKDGEHWKRASGKSPALQCAMHFFKERDDWRQTGKLFAFRLQRGSRHRWSGGRPETSLRHLGRHRQRGLAHGLHGPEGEYSGRSGAHIFMGELVKNEKSIFRFPRPLPNGCKARGSVALLGIPFLWKAKAACVPSGFAWPTTNTSFSFQSQLHPTCNEILYIMYFTQGPFTDYSAPPDLHLE